MNEEPPLWRLFFCPGSTCSIIEYIFLMKNLTVHIREDLISSSGRAGSGQRMIDDATKGMIINQLISQEMIMPVGPGADFMEYEDTREWLESISYAQGKTLVIDLSKTDSRDVAEVNFNIKSADLPNIKILPSNDPDQVIFMLVDIRSDRKICQWISGAFEKCPIWTIQADRGGTIEDLDIMTPETLYIQGNKRLTGYLEVKSLRLRHPKGLRILHLNTLEDVPKDMKLGALSSGGIIYHEYVSDIIFQDVLKVFAGDLSRRGNTIEADLSKYDIRHDRIYDKVSCTDDLGKELDKILIPADLKNAPEIEVTVFPRGNLNAAASRGGKTYKITCMVLTRWNNEWAIRFTTR